MKRNQKWKGPHTVSKRWTLRFSSNKNLKLSVKLWWIGADVRKKIEFSVTFYLSEGNLTLGGSRVDSDFHLKMSRYIKWVPGTSGELVVKCKLPSQKGSSL